MSGAVHSARAQTALRALAEADPALAALSLWCLHRDGAETRTAGDVITYGPAFEALPPHEQRGLAAHHILHVALRHSARQADLARRLGDGFDPALFNLAADALVNEVVLLADHALPRPAVTVTGLLREALKTEIEAPAALAEWDVERLYFALAAGTGQGRPREGAQEYARAQSFDEDLEPEAGAPDEAGTAEEAARWRQHMSRALDAGRAAGRGIGRHLHRLADVPQARTPWEVILRRLLAQAVTVMPQPSPRRPSRRWIATTAEAVRSGDPQPGFQPGQRPLTEVPRIAVGLDASSSIDEARLALFWGEVTGIARRMRAEVHLLVFDDAVRYRARLGVGESRFALPELPRGGGTAFAPVIKEAQALGASVLVMLTDLDGDAGAKPRDFPVIWAVPEPTGAAPHFGRVLDLSA